MPIQSVISYTPTAMLWIYRLIVLLLLPLALLRLRRAPDEALNHSWRERLGDLPDQPNSAAQSKIWLHAASVGEVNAVKPLVQHLLDSGHPLMMSTMTHSGIRHLDQTLTHPGLSTALAPLDTQFAVQRWLKQVRPAAVIIVETELWPEMLHQCHARQIPVILVNARLTATAARRYRWIKPLFKPQLARISLALTQSEADSQRFIDLGLRPAAQTVVGNLKFDQPDCGPRTVSDGMQWLTDTATERKCWVAGSTRSGEDRIMFEAHRLIQADHPDALLILAPRHVTRSAAILRQVHAHDLKGMRLSQWQVSPVTTPPDVIILDGIGELTETYRLAQACFVGGSLVPVGGHNLIEPAALGKPVLSGPHLSNQAEAAQCLDASAALIRIDGAGQLAAEVSALLADTDRTRQLGGRAKAALASHQGSLEATLQSITPLLGGSAQRSN